MCNQCLSPLTFWDRISPRRGVLDTTLCDMRQGRWFFPGTAVSSTNKTDNHDIADITEIYLNVTLSNIKPNQTMTWLCLTVTEYLCHKWPRTCFTCRKHFLVLYLFMISLSWIVFVTRVTRCVSPVEQELHTLQEYLTLSPVCSGIRVARFLVFYVVVFFIVVYPFVLLSFSSYSLCCLSFFHLRVLINPLFSSNSSCCLLCTRPTHLVGC